MMKNSDIFYFDVDGTLLDTKSHTFLDSTIYSLKKLKEKGYRVALCTGRTLDAIQSIGIPDFIEWDGFVLANGALVLDRNLDVIFRKALSPEWVSKLISLHKGTLLLEGDEIMMVNKPNETFLLSMKHFNIDPNFPETNYTNQVVYKVLSYGFNDLRQEDVDWILEDADFVYDIIKNREISPKNINKFLGVQALNNHLNTNISTGFGDGDNDVEFLEGVTFGVAMGNGTEGVKKVSDYETDPSWDDGIYKALVKFGVIEEEL
ncbi:HAD-IIB family hydrolase [Erysipelothrix sp. HDW6A]|uniref:HAD-IIB family hydrolase n=1 Tax=Erysipelothrix sp. HDW6A TaxID=2714928 RepID=UPI00140BA7E5|nr:HAD-IIB family hydrolase [Erysipelothrix sp. HDW6A]QIK57396.1 HAD-IIB family hydrolase [Erysipelothrix sp. HDW6A]